MTNQIRGGESTREERKSIEYLVSQKYINVIFMPSDPSDACSNIEFDRYEISESGKIVYELRKTEDRRFRIPTTISIIAITLSVIAITVSIVALVLTQI